MPEVWHGLLAAGAVPARLPGQRGVPAGLHCRRVTFERVLRSAAQAEPGVRLRTGHVDEVSCERWLRQLTPGLSVRQQVTERGRGEGQPRAKPPLCAASGLASTRPVASAELLDLRGETSEAQVFKPGPVRSRCAR